MSRAMNKDKSRWMDDYSVLVDCMYAALNDGGIVKDLVEEFGFMFLFVLICYFSRGPHQRLGRSLF